ncbi:hypothetical protein L1049_021353 [Liquidambar formosana]|uniref:RRM domain-containing protein n=1 Tax=Liquidambar formosana TaxID=63359 RepID=A0AAP0S9H4_LIQFO
MTAANVAGQFGDTTYTKVFVGGLAWETQNETMKNYFQQFGEILEAVVITDKNTGRSKGYGFVTFKEAEAAKRACVDAAPVIDGRRANCNLASLGVQRSRPSTPQHGGGRSFRQNSFHAGFQGGVGTAFPSAPTYPHYAIQPGVPYNVYGYSTCSPDYTYPTGFYNVYGGTTSQYPVYGTGAGGLVTNANMNFYPYFQFGLGFGSAATNSAGQSFGFQNPQQYYQYSTLTSSGLPQHYGAPMSLMPTPPSQAGVSVTLPLTVPALHAPTPHHQTHSNSLHPISTI